MDTNNSRFVYSSHYCNMYCFAMQRLSWASVTNRLENCQHKPGIYSMPMAELQYIVCSYNSYNISRFTCVKYLEAVKLKRIMSCITLTKTAKNCLKKYLNSQSFQSSKTSESIFVDLCDKVFVKIAKNELWACLCSKQREVNKFENLHKKSDRMQ